MRHQSYFNTDHPLWFHKKALKSIFASHIQNHCSHPSNRTPLESQSMMPTHITIRPYEPTDTADTIDVFLRSIQKIAIHDYQPEQIAAWAQVPDSEAWSHARLNQSTWVAIDQKKLIGFIDLLPSGYIDMLFIAPEYQKQGIASLLLCNIEKIALNNGLTQLTTHASITARPFFEHHGFQVDIEQKVKKRGQYFTNFAMSKELHKLKIEKP